MSFLKLNYFLRFILLFVFAILFLFSCSDDDDMSIETTDFWYTPEKGYVLERRGNNYKLYGTSTSGCVLIDNDLRSENYAGIAFNEFGDQLIGSSELLAGNINFNRLINVDEYCDLNMLAQTNDPEVNFQYFWDIFNDYYAFFELRNVNWQDKLALKTTVNPNTLYDVLERMILPLQDGHVSIVNEDLDINSNRAHLLEIINSNLSPNDHIETTDALISILNQRISFINSTYLNNATNSDSNGNMVWGLLTEDVGYFNVISMEGYAAIDKELSTVDDLMTEIMQDVAAANVDKLVIDLRFNTGGHDGVSLEIASRFVTSTRNVFTKKAKIKNGFTDKQTISLVPKGDYQFTGDIVLLTSPVTASAAEIFVLCLKDLPNVTIVGQNTNGAFSEILTHRLPNGTFIGLSNQIYADNAGNVFEGIGIGPVQEENEIPFLSSPDFINSIDSGIERSLAILE
ncbi:S41 family peptidase [Cellulophaga sp. F20128]|uniref:S41 family peptidase n=1 Tax=Cellulophaga sp. F20128 TaxID=2926413 RepID=UPI001FF5FED3|nr:S41 family peptidase [Cellulophaga sp. F20128]MCK0158201.1 S41 family peptidase [Cellulophaga sp. F20128]